MNPIQRFFQFINELLDTAEQAKRGEAAAVYASMAMVALCTTAIAVLILIVGVHLASSLLISGTALVAPCGL